MKNPLMAIIMAPTPFRNDSYLLKIERITIKNKEYNNIRI